MSCNECHSPCVVNGVYQGIDCNQARTWCDPCGTQLSPDYLNHPYGYLPVPSETCPGDCKAYYTYGFEVDGPSFITTDCFCESGPGGRVGCMSSQYDGPQPATIYGLCCVPRSYMDAYYPGSSNCEVYTSETCCGHLGGTWKGNRLPGACGGVCPSPSCCGCDWCCKLSPVDCAAIKAFSWESAPRAGVPGTNCADHPSCGASPTSPAPTPACRREEFAVCPDPGSNEAMPRRPGRHQIFSEAPIRAIDRVPGAVECRTYFGFVGRGAPFTPTRRTVGYLCNQYNRRQTNTKVMQRCPVVKRSDGRHAFSCGFRTPCPEKPTTCL